MNEAVSLCARAAGRAYPWHDCGRHTGFALETYEAKMAGQRRGVAGRIDMIDAFGPKTLKPGHYLWRDVPPMAGPERVVISLSDQMAYLYRGDTLMAVSTFRAARTTSRRPTGIFAVLDKQPMYRFEEIRQCADAVGCNASTVTASRCTPAITPVCRQATAASACRAAFAKKLYSVTDVGTPIYIGA